MSRPATLAVALALAAPLASFAQSNAAPARITAQISESNLTTLRGNTHPLARPQYDQGAVADSQPMRRMLLLLQRSPQQEAALRTFIDQQQSKASPNYHQWLTPQQFGQQYGPSAADIQTVTGWLQSHGFQVARVSTGGTLVEFSGTAGQVRNAFHTEIHKYLVSGEQRFANNSDPQIPAALAPVVAGPVSLHNFPKKAMSRNLGVFKKDLSTGNVVPELSFGCTNVFGAAATCNALSPGDFAKIYNVQSLWDAGIDGTGQTIALVGDSEICTASSPAFSQCAGVDDTLAFRTLFGLSTTNLPTVILDGPDPGFNGDELEGNLDVQWSGAVAKAASIDFVIAQNTEATAGTDLAAEYVVDNNLAPVLSESFGACEFSLGNNGNQYEATLWEQAAAQGITVIVSSGDSDAAGCDDPNFSAPNPAQQGVNVNGIASTAFNVAAGGTDFDITLPTPSTYQSTYWGPNATVSGNKSESVLSYVPETTWNDSCAQTFTIGMVTGCNSPSSTAAVNIVGGSGGQSNCVITNNFNQCTAFYPKPAWQTVATGSGFTASTDITRDLPDVSLFAADGFVSNSFYAICDLNFSTGPCSTTTGSVDIVGVGGTSAAAPSFAGMMALVNQKMTTLHATNSQIPTRQGNPNYVLYALAKNQGSLSCNSSSTPAAGCTFNDVTKGNNSTPCLGQTLNCSNQANSGSYGVLEELNTLGNPNGVLAFNAGTGLDLATGLGSVNAANLVNNWAAVVGAFTPTATTLCMSTASSTLSSCVPGAITITHGATVWVNIGVTPSPGTGTNTKAEDVSLIGSFPGGATAGVDLFTSNNYVLYNADIYPLTSGTASGATTTALEGGNYTVIAHYAGDGTFGASNSTSPITVTVNPEASTTALSTVIYNFNSGNGFNSTQAYYGDSIFVRADVVGASGQQSATGLVTITDSVGGLGAFKLNTEGYAEDQTGAYVSGVFTPPLAVGAHSFTASFAGDQSYKLSSTASALAFAVLQAPTTSVVTPSATSVVANTPFSLSVFVDTQSGSALSSGGSSGAAPTGTVTFFAGSTMLGSPVNVTATTDSLAYVAAQATLSNVKLTANANITAMYSGDANYSASTSPAVSVTVSNGTFTLSPSNSGNLTASAPGQSGTDTITVNGTNFTGAITLAVSSVSPNNLTDPPSCSFGTTGTITLNSGATPPVETGTGTLTCTTTAASSALLFHPSSHRKPNWPLLNGLAIAIASLWLLGMAGRIRRGGVLLATVLIVVSAVGISCGGGSSTGGTGGGNPGTTVGNYTVNVTATPASGSPQQVALTLTVN